MTKKEYTAPEADIEKFALNVDVMTTSTGNEGGDTEYDDPFGDGAF